MTTQQVIFRLSSRKFIFTTINSVMDNLLQSKVLKDLGLTEKNQWILHDEKVRPFFEYLAENFDDDNVLSPAEYEQYKDLVASGQFLEGEALSQELQELESKYPGISTITDECVEELEREVAFMNMQIKEQDSSVARMEEYKKTQLKEMEALEDQNHELDYQEELLTKECLEKSKTLEDLQKSNQQMVAELRQSYTQPQNPPCLLYQMPLDQHYHACEQFLAHLETFMRKNFKTTNSLEEIDIDCQMNAEISEIKKRIFEIEGKKLETSLTIAGYNHFMQNLEVFKIRAGTDCNELRSIIEDVEAENESMSFQVDVLQKEALMLLRQSAEQKMTQLFHEHVKEKSKRALTRLDAVKSVTDMTQNVALLCELLWVVMYLDIDRIKNRADNSEDIASQAQDCIKRMRAMKTIASSNPIAALDEFFLTKLQDMMTANLPAKRDELASIAACLEEYIKLDERSQLSVKAGLNQENLKDFHDVMRPIENQSEELRNFIFTGPNKLPKLYDTIFTTAIYEAEQRTRQVEKGFRDEKSNYVKHIIEPGKNDRMWRMEKNLWIFFLTQPKRVLESIQEVQKAAAEKNTVSFKAMNITIPKKN